jgi:hypothetical protein
MKNLYEDGFPVLHNQMIAVVEHSRIFYSHLRCKYKRERPLKNPHPPLDALRDTAYADAAVNQS